MLMTVPRLRFNLLNCNPPPPPGIKQRAKMPSYRPPDYLIQERLKKDAEIENLEDFTRYDKTCFMKNSWLKSSENRFVRGAIQRQVRDVFVQQEVLLQEKKERSVCCQYIILGWGGGHTDPIHSVIHQCLPSRPNSSSAILLQTTFFRQTCAR